jgi:hypothetical protein
MLDWPCSSKVAPPPTSARRKLVLCAGKFVAWKGFSYAIRASARVDLPHDLVILGDGPAAARESLRHEAERLGVTSRYRATWTTRRSRRGCGRPTSSSCLRCTSRSGSSFWKPWPAGAGASRANRAGPGSSCRRRWSVSGSLRLWRRWPTPVPVPSTGISTTSPPRCGSNWPRRPALRLERRCPPRWPT